MRKWWQRFSRWLFSGYRPDYRVNVPLFELIESVGLVIFLGIISRILKNTMPDDPTRWAALFIIGLGQWYSLWWFTVERWRINFRIFRLTLLTLLVISILTDLLRLP